MGRGHTAAIEVTVELLAVETNFAADLRDAHAFRTQVT
jgi:hypothetical protein